MIGSLKDNACRRKKKKQQKNIGLIFAIHCGGMSCYLEIRIETKPTELD